MLSITKMLRVKKEDVPLMYIVYFAFFVSGMMNTLIGTILPFMKAEYNMSYVLSGAVISAHQVGNFFALLISGFLPYLIGRKRSTVTLSLGFVIGFLLMTLTGNPLFLLLAFLLTGIGRGTMSNITNVVMSDISENKTAALNLLHASFAIGAFLAPFLAIFTTTVFGVHWRISLWTVVVLEIIVMVLFSRSTLSGKSIEKEKDIATGFHKDKSYWLNTAILFFYLCNEASIMGWLVTYFTDSGILSPSLAQTTSSALWVFILIGRLSCAYLSTKLGKNMLLVLLGFFQIVFFLLMVSSKNIVFIYMSIFGFGLAMSGTYPTVLATMNPKYNASTIAVGTTIAVATIGAIGMPIIVGAVAQQIGIAGGLATISIALVCMFALILVKFFIGKKRAKNVWEY
ncbi:MAG TPA: MFS transporter [Sphaerochaeta sp.]|nr:MFS transporter [Sphaerochaeta sp.]